MSDRVLVAVVGPTASGKSALALALAERLGGEIVNADSRQVYRGMDAGTAKPSRADRERRPHHLLDVAAPDERFSLGRYLDLARATLDGCWSRDVMPVLAGGTGQYVWALLEGWQVPRVPPDDDLRAELEALAEREGPQALVAELDPDRAEAIDPSNVRRLVRAVEVQRRAGAPVSTCRAEPDFRSVLIGLDWPRDALYARIDARVDGMVEAGLVDEVRRLNERGYGCDLPSMSAIGYRQVCEHLAGELSLDEAVARIKTQSHRLARMQATWFRRDDPRIAWLPGGGPFDDALRVVESKLRTP